MKGITLCAECAYYSMKKHKCTRGAKDEGEPTARFYADCPLDDVVPAVHGKWIEERAGKGMYDYRFQCSECKCHTPDKAYTIAPDFCPNCGAKMDGGKENV